VNINPASSGEAAGRAEVVPPQWPRGARVDATVVIITRDRREQLAETLRQLGQLPEQPAVIVVDNGSSDETPAMVRAAFPDVRLVSAAPTQRRPTSPSATMTPVGSQDP
jgi:hypothetical protein